MHPGATIRLPGPRAGSRRHSDGDMTGLRISGYGPALENGRAGARYIAVGEEDVALRDIAR
jgi:hypothetical protein